MANFWDKIKGAVTEFVEKQRDIAEAGGPVNEAPKIIPALDLTPARPKTEDNKPLVENKKEDLDNVEPKFSGLPDEPSQTNWQNHIAGMGKQTPLKAEEEKSSENASGTLVMKKFREVTMLLSPIKPRITQSLIAAGVRAKRNANGLGSLLCPAPPACQTRWAKYCSPPAPRAAAAPHCRACVRFPPQRLWPLPSSHGG